MDNLVALCSYGVGKVTIKNRIRFGYLLFILSLASVPLVEKGIENKLISRGAGFWLTLLSVSLVAVGGGIQQSSFYGFAAFLPPMYTQGLMFGESLAGVIVSKNYTNCRSRGMRARCADFPLPGSTWMCCRVPFVLEWVDCSDGHRFY